jgi:hypothetical protein
MDGTHMGRADLYQWVRIPVRAQRVYPRPLVKVSPTHAHNAQLSPPGQPLLKKQPPLTSLRTRLVHLAAAV